MSFEYICVPVWVPTGSSLFESLYFKAHSLISPPSLSSRYLPALGPLAAPEPLLLLLPDTAAKALASAVATAFCTSVATAWLLACAAPPAQCRTPAAGLHTLLNACVCVAASQSHISWIADHRLIGAWHP